MRFRKRAGIWYVRFTVDGERIEKTTGCADRKAAEARAREFERDAADPERAARRAADAATLQVAVDLAAAHYAAAVKAGKRAKATEAFYRRKLGHLVRVFDSGRKLLKEIDARAVDAYVETRREEGARDHTIHKELGALLVALRLARRRGLWRGDLDTLKPDGWSNGYRPRERFLTLPEVQALTKKLLPDRAARVAFMVATSAEWGATERAARGDYDKVADLVHVRGTKRESRDRYVPVVLPECRELLTFALAHGEGTGGLLFRPWSKGWRDIQGACRRAGIAPCSPNDLRRTFAVWHRAAGISLDDIATAMGHVDTTMLHRVYGRVTPTQLGALMRAQAAKISGKDPAGPSR